MGDPLLREPVSPRPYQIPAEPAEEETPFLGRGAAQDVFSEFQRRWEELKNRIGSVRTIYDSSFARELRKNGEAVRSRVRYYHEHRPLHVLGTIALTTFAVGLLVGLRRR